MENRTPRRLPVLDEVIPRRDAVKILAAAAALAAAPGCERALPEKILPYTRQPPTVTPGVPRYYTTSLTLDGYATGVLVKSHEGRPTKIEGNPDHPASLGATTAWQQAQVLGLYDPDRARAPRVPPPYNTAGDPFLARFGAPRPDAGERLRFLLEPHGSPLLAALLAAVRERFPRARFTHYSPTRTGAALAGARIARGAPVQPLHDLGKAQVILAIDDDLLDQAPFALRYARQFAARRRISRPSDSMNRLYVVETAMSATGAIADHRIRRRPGDIAAFALQLAAQLAPDAPHKPPDVLRAALDLQRKPDIDPAVAAVARDLRAHAGAALVTAGDAQPPVVHALAQLLNTMLGSGDCTWNIAPTVCDAGPAEQDLSALLADIDQGAVDTLVILGENPVYAAPADLDLAARLARIDTVLYHGQHEDETAACAAWFIPAAHPLESWGDAAACDGTLSIVQPLIRPLHGGRTTAEVLALFAGVQRPDARRLLEDAWTRRHPGDFSEIWPRALTCGLVADTASPRVDRDLQPDSLARAVATYTPPPADLQIRFSPDPALHDGRFAGNAWLLEWPRPVTKITWDNAALVSAATAARLGLQSEDLVDLHLDGRRVRAPVFIAPGHADDAVTVHLGWGRRKGPSLAAGAGFDANRIRSAARPTFAAGLSVRRVPGAKYTLARTQLHLRDDPHRPIALSTTLAGLRAHPDLTEHLRGPLPTVYAPFPQEGEQWAMTIDTTLCTGCGACVTACQAENNVLAVGKDEVQRGRIMHWIRIDQYFSGSMDAPSVVSEPMLCQHCETAPCEYVCPVNATEHSADGLNEMIYNRCVGTRFCSNNCPYKVRRFNWFNWNNAPENQGSVSLQRNPDVTVRARGVMEKCTYCVQRIREAEIHARLQRRALRPGEVVTACAQACPTSAIQFGSLRHTGTPMVQWRDEARSYAVLHDIGTRPRTMYLCRVTNPNPEMG